MPERTVLWWLLIGLVAGVVGRFLLPGRDPGGFVTTILIGIAGALAAGFLIRAMGWAVADDWPGLVAALGGAVILLAFYRLIAARRIG